MSNNLTLLSSTPNKPEEKESAPPKLSLLSSKPAQEKQPVVEQSASSQQSAPTSLQLLSSAPTSTPKEAAPSKPATLSLLSSNNSVVESKPAPKADVPALVLPGQEKVTTVTLKAPKAQLKVAEEQLPVADAEAASNNGALAITFIAVIMAVGCAVAAAVFYLRSKSKSGRSTLVGQAPKPAAAEPVPASSEPTPRPQASDPHAVNAEIPSKPVPSVSDDPIIQFLNGEADEGDGTSAEPEAIPAAPAKPAASAVPPRKPAKPGMVGSHPAPPPKPGSRMSSAPEAPNAPSGLKAPSKPKKRF